MTQVKDFIFQLKGGNEDSLLRNNPLLKRREPIVVFCNDGTTKMKIGDGVHTYRELDWLKIDGGNNNVKEVEIFNTHFEFPIPGDPSIIYRATNEATLYQWNDSQYKYEPLVNPDIDISDIKIIDGGRASDLL